jgi:hypothetical protein
MNEMILPAALAAGEYEFVQRCCVVASSAVSASVPELGSTRVAL